MKAKTKLIMSIMSVCLVCAVFAIGVFALRTANLKIGGDVSFSATGVEADIKNATLTGATTNNQVLTTGSINTTMTQTDIDSTFQNWQTLELDFNENADDIELKFNIANTSTNADNYIEIDYDYSFTTANPNVDVFPGDENAQGVWENNNYILTPKGSAETATYETFTLKFRVLNKELNVPQGTKVSVNIELKHHIVQSAAADANKVVAIDNVKYTLNESAGTASVTGDSITTAGTASVIYPVVKSTAEGAVPCIVTSIGSSVFEDCSGLTSINIPNSVTSIRMEAFTRCYNLASITIPSSVTSIGDSAFCNCGSLTSIVVASGNSVYDSRNNCNAIIETATNKLIKGCKNTIIPNTVTGIEFRAFSGCSELTTITIPSGVLSVEGYAFQDCSDLTTITIPSGVLSIGNCAFYGCSSLTSVTISNTVTSIGDAAFADCTNLTSITIPSGVTSIGSSAFETCDNLSTAKFENPNGWFKSSSATATSGTPVTVTSEFTEDNATVLKGISYDEYLLRKTA